MTAMAEGERERELRDEWARLDAATADGELSADDVAAKVKRKAEVRAEMERLGMGTLPDQEAATYRDPG